MPDPVLCITCGYDLRTLDRGGLCPECGTPVARSIHGDWLRYASEAYIRRLTLGLRWLTRARAAIFWAFLATICLLAAGGIFLRVLTSNPPPVYERWLTVFFFAAWALIALSFLVTCSMLWIIARPDPALVSRESRVTVAAPYVIAGSVFGLALWIAVHALPLKAVVIEILIHLCYLVVWAGIALMPVISAPIDRRCQAVTGDRLRALRRPPWGVLILAALGLLLYWTGPSRSWPGPWTMPTAETRETLLMFTVLAWIIAAGRFRTTRKLVEEELQERHEGRDPR